MPARLSRRHGLAEVTRGVAKANGKARDARDDPRARIPGRPGPLTAIGAYARRKEARVFSSISFSFRRTSSPETPSHAHSRGPLRSLFRSRGALAPLVRAACM